MAMTEQPIRSQPLGMVAEISLAAYKHAEAELRREEARIGFFAHLIVYVLMNTLLIFINLVFAPASLWFFYPLIAWGFGLSMHYLYGVRWLDRTIEDWESRVEYRAKQNLSPRWKE